MEITPLTSDTLIDMEAGPSKPTTTEAVGEQVPHASSQSPSSMSTSSAYLKRILSADDYNTIELFVLNFCGLAVDCEKAILEQYGLDVEALSLKSILRTVLGRRIEAQSSRMDRKAKQYLGEYESNLADDVDCTLLVRLAARHSFSPVRFSKLVLRAKCDEKEDFALNRYIANTDLISDERLAENVKNCIKSDIVDGPLAEVRRQIMRANYRSLLKEKVDACKIPYYENRTNPGSPYITLLVPFVYRGTAIYWLESKAYFADVTMHESYMTHQLQGFLATLGSGIVIYWLGYQEGVDAIGLESGIIVLDRFPENSEIALLENKMVDDAYEVDADDEFVEEEHEESN